MTFFNYPLLLVLSCTFLAFSSPVSAKTEAEKQKLEQFFKDLEGFTRVFGNIKQLYVDEADNETLFNDAIKGMVSGLDPHSSYLEPEEQKDLLENASGKFGGLGIVIGMKDKTIQVISPIDDTPAYRAGLQAGDLIVKIGDKLARGMTLGDGVKLMRGEPGTEIELTIARENAKPFKVIIVRDIITIVSVRGHLLEKNIGYIRISSFQGPTANLLEQKFEEISDQNQAELTALILDLRNNPGGVLDGAVDVSDLFIDKEDALVVYTKGRIRGSNMEFKTTAGDISNGIPIVVLINEGSASASEIVAGSLQDHKRAVIMGKTSFGKGSVQTILDIKGGYGLKLTTARYYTPKGRSIQAKGIEPDVTLKNISLDNEKDDSIINAKEKDLTGHLTTEDPSILSTEAILESQEKSKGEQDEKAIEILKKDYFVHEATNLLKALIVLGK